MSPYSVNVFKMAEPAVNGDQQSKFNALVEVASTMHHVEKAEDEKKKCGMPDHLREKLKHVPNRPYPVRQGEDPNLPKIAVNEPMCKEYCNHCSDRINGPKVEIPFHEKMKRRENIANLVATAFHLRVKRAFTTSIYDGPGPGSK